MLFRRALVTAAAVTLVLVGCGARSSAGDQGAATELTAAELESETGPCVCRLPEDEGMTCCRSGLLLACQCDGRWSCHTTPTGRSCGSAGRRR